MEKMKKLMGKDKYYTCFSSCLFDHGCIVASDCTKRIFSIISLSRFPKPARARAQVQVASLAVCSIIKS